MKTRDFISRRAFVAASLASALSPFRASAEQEVLELSWGDLVPSGEGLALRALRELGVVQHGQYSSSFIQDTNGDVTDEFNGRMVRIPGYVVPLDYDGLGVTSFILVPYIGACIHVPPPPPNQLVFVSTEDPYASRGLFEPVFVTGVFGTTATDTALAEIGYAMAADKIEPYG
ncbi:MAG: DUF3299 domain-containing protein [Pseudomonadota bacterium]